MVIALDRDTSLRCIFLGATIKSIATHRKPDTFEDELVMLLDQGGTTVTVSIPVVDVGRINYIEYRQGKT